MQQRFSLIHLHSLGFQTTLFYDQALNIILCTLSVSTTVQKGNVKKGKKQCFLSKTREDNSNCTYPCTYGTLNSFLTCQMAFNQKSCSAPCTHALCRPSTKERCWNVPLMLVEENMHKYDTRMTPSCKICS